MKNYKTQKNTSLYQRKHIIAFELHMVYNSNIFISIKQIIILML